MNEPNSQTEKPKDERRYDPELLKRGLRRDLDQEEFLKKCSEKGEEGIKEWNEWRWKKQNRHKDIHLEDADVSHAHLEGTDCKRAIVDGRTSLWECKVDRKTDFLGVSLDIAKIDPGTKQLLKYNIRRKNWDEWYKEHWILRWPVRWFWLLSDYGLRTWWIIIWFFRACIWIRSRVLVVSE